MKLFNFTLGGNATTPNIKEETMCKKKKNQPKKIMH